MYPSLLTVFFNRRSMGAVFAFLSFSLSSGPAASFEQGDFDRLAKSYAGLVEAKPGTSADDASPSYRKSVNASWTAYQQRLGQPMGKWSKQEIAYPGAGTVFYPFSGPDLVTVAQLFPDADRYVLVAIQSARRPADLDALQPKHRSAFRAKFAREWTKFGTLGFFRTNDLDDDVQAKEEDQIGVTTILMTFAARLGYVVEDVYPIELNAASGEMEKADPAKSWESVRLVLSRAGKKANVDYVRMDLSDYGLTTVAGRREWFAGMARNPVLLKAASHLLPKSYFSVARDGLVAAAPMVVQDETGLDYNDLVKVGEVTLYGRFSRPHRLFDQGDQRSLATAYRKQGAGRELPFSYSYQKSANQNCLQIARRKSGQPPSSPVLKNEGGRTPGQQKTQPGG